jgi:CheY-like chemotaxis protein
MTSGGPQLCSTADRRGTAAVISSSPGKLTRYRVLITDDAREVRKALRYALGDEVELVVVGGAGAGDEALYCVTKLAPDIVILAIELPGLDGYAAARSLKASSDVHME